jgi:hypothetical protein
VKFSSRTSTAKLKPPTSVCGRERVPETELLLCGMESIHAARVEGKRYGEGHRIRPVTGKYQEARFDRDTRNSGVTEWEDQFVKTALGITQISQDFNPIAAVSAILSMLG